MIESPYTMNLNLLLLSTFFLIILCSFPAVRSDPILKMPTDSDSDSGACAGFSSPVCPISCFRPDPVCGVDGVTYWCGCPEAQCAGVKVAKLGFCEVGSGGSAPQALLLVHIVWLIVLGFSVLFGLF